jgi:hypothetical protein
MTIAAWQWEGRAFSTQRRNTHRREKELKGKGKGRGALVGVATTNDDNGGDREGDGHARNVPSDEFLDLQQNLAVEADFAIFGGGRRTHI